MPKFNVYLLTVGATWEGIDAADEVAAINNVLLDDSNLVLDQYRKSDEPWRLVTEEIEDDDEEEEMLNAMDAMEEADAYDIED